MDASTSLETHPHPHQHEAGHEHHELGWWRKYVFSTDHKVIGIQYGITGLLFLLLGFSLMMLMRWQLAYPGQALPVIGKFLPHIFGPGSMPDGKMTPDFYNSLGAMHGTIMIFLGVVPLAFAAFGNFVVPLQIGAPDMAFPKVNMASYWALFVGGIIMLTSFFVPGGAAKSGWTSYVPLAAIADKGPGYNPILNGQSLWLIGFIFLITSSLLGAVNFITTIIQLRAKGLTWMRLPFFVWAQFVTAFLLLLAFPPLESAIIMQLMDRVAHTSFFLPSGLVVNGTAMQISGGGSPLLWQHLFWFLGHPEVYVLILPAFGIVAEILANNSRKPLWGYKSLVFSVLVIGFLSFIVWAHHMWLTGMGSTVSAFFQTTTLLISIPSVIILSAFFISLWGGSIRFNVPMLFATVFLPMFLQGMLGMHRRWYDGGQGWTLSGEHIWGLSGFQWNSPISWAAWIMGLAQIPFIINFFWSIKHGRKVNDNPWEATTLEWTAPSPPPHGNFVITPVAYRGPYEYSLPGREKDFTMQNEPGEPTERTRRKVSAEPVLA